VVAPQCCLRTPFDWVLYTGGLYAESIDSRSYYDPTTTSDKRRLGVDDDKDGSRYICTASHVSALTKSASPPVNLHKAEGSFVSENFVSTGSWYPILTKIKYRAPIRLLASSS